MRNMRNKNESVESLNAISRNERYPHTLFSILWQSENVGDWLVHTKMEKDETRSVDR